MSEGRCLLGVGLGQARSEFTSIRPRDAGVHRERCSRKDWRRCTVSLPKARSPSRACIINATTCALPQGRYRDPFPSTSRERHSDAEPGREMGERVVLVPRPDPNIKEPVDALARCLEEVGRERREIDLVVTKGLSLGTSREQAIERFQASLLPGRMDELSVEFCLEGRPRRSATSNRTLSVRRHRWPSSWRRYATAGLTTVSSCISR